MASLEENWWIWLGNDSNRLKHLYERFSKFVFYQEMCWGKTRITGMNMVNFPNPFLFVTIRKLDFSLQPFSSSHFWVDIKACKYLCCIQVQLCKPSIVFDWRN
jgi:hypothetical protein